MNEKTEPKYEATLYGGFYDGMKFLLHEPSQELNHIVHAINKKGETFEVCRAKYRLASEGPPLRYVISN